MSRARDRFFVAVSGPPASGKSTLAPALATALDLPLLAKDTIKDALMSALGAPDLDASRRLGGAAVDVMCALAAELSGAVLEAPFSRSRARPRLAALGGPVRRAAATNALLVRLGRRHAVPDLRNALLVRLFRGG